MHQHQICSRHYALMNFLDVISRTIYIEPNVLKNYHCLSISSRYALYVSVEKNPMDGEILYQWQPANEYDKSTIISAV